MEGILVIALRLAGLISMICLVIDWFREHRAKNKQVNKNDKMGKFDSMS